LREIASDDDRRPGRYALVIGRVISQAIGKRHKLYFSEIL
jgi:hypothetical protein